MDLNLNAAARSGDRLRALVYRGKTASAQCPESLRDLLVASIPGISVDFAGPDEDIKINADTLARVDLLAQPGGPDLDDAWAEARHYASDVRHFVAGGGRYLGVCLGAFLAGHDPGFGLIPQGDNIDSEIDRAGAAVPHDSDAVLQIDYTFSNGRKKGMTERRWAYFQDGTTFDLSAQSPAKVLARYSSNGDVAAILSSFGKGWVANIGVHPEANQDWYDDAGIENPEGIQTDIGQDFVVALMRASE